MAMATVAREVSGDGERGAEGGEGDIGGWLRSAPLLPSVTFCFCELFHGGGVYTHLQ